MGWNSGAPRKSNPKAMIFLIVFSFRHQGIPEGSC